jgi:DNA-directed RNA polymerase subunit N (RpoN/RPB10)
LCCRRTMLQHSKQNSDSAPYSPKNYFNIIS